MFDCIWLKLTQSGKNYQNYKLNKAESLFFILEKSRSYSCSLNYRKYESIQFRFYIYKQHFLEIRAHGTWSSFNVTQS